MDIKEHLRKSLSNKYLWKQAVWVIAINSIKKKYSGSQINGYIKFDKLFIKVSDTETKIKLFQEKKSVIETANQSLEKIWYTQKISQIFIKFSKENNSETYL